LREHRVRYLLVGGYAVGYHGYPRATADMDIWVAMEPSNASRIVTVLREFGFAVPELSADLFLKDGQIIRMGVPPVRLEIITSISGVEFNQCFEERVTDVFDGVEVNLISLKHLKINKRASGRHIDLNDLENLPE
jgi:hypothetical protein